MEVYLVWSSDEPCGCGSRGLVGVYATIHGAREQMKSYVTRRHKMHRSGFYLFFAEDGNSSWINYRRRSEGEIGVLRVWTQAVPLQGSPLHLLAAQAERQV